MLDCKKTKTYINKVSNHKMTLSRFETLRNNNWTLFFCFKKVKIYSDAVIYQNWSHTHERGQVQVKWHESRLGNYILSFWKIRENWLQVRDHEFLTTDLWKRSSRATYSRDFFDSSTPRGLVSRRTLCVSERDSIKHCIRDGKKWEVF